MSAAFSHNDAMNALLCPSLSISCTTKLHAIISIELVFTSRKLLLIISILSNNSIFIAIETEKVMVNVILANMGYA